MDSIWKQQELDASILYKLGAALTCAERCSDLTGEDGLMPVICWAGGRLAVPLPCNVSGECNAFPRSTGPPMPRTSVQCTQQCQRGDTKMQRATHASLQGAKRREHRVL
jgi:hypothetical protein